MFKVGDKVRHSDGTIGTVIEDFPHDRLVTVHYNDEYGTCTDHYSDVIPAGPVREVVPGNYGRVIVGKTYEAGIWFEITVDEKGALILTAEELDNVAMIASQLAEALRDG